MSNLKAYKYRLYPNKKQAEKLQWTLDRARELYNAAIQERRDAYEIRVKRHPNCHDEATRKQLTQEHALNYNQQATQLPEMKEFRHTRRSFVASKRGKHPAIRVFMDTGAMKTCRIKRETPHWSVIPQKKPQALTWDCCILPPSQMEARLRIHAICATANTS